MPAMAKSQHTQAPGGAYLYDEDDFLSFLREPSSKGPHGLSDSFEFEQFTHPAELTGKGASGWEHSFVFNDELSGPITTTPASVENLGRQDLIFLDLEEAGFDFAKGGSGSGGGGSTSGSGLPSTYTAGASGDYNITIQFKGTWTTDLYSGFTTVADKLCDYIVEDLPNVFYKGKLIDDIVITAELKPIDGEGGILGQAGPTAIRTGTYLPALASMQFDSADAAAYLEDELWDDIVLHEMLHSIGFGTIWPYLDVVDRTTFVGENATAVYGGPIPIEQEGGSGTAGSHWDEETFDNELMTGYINASNVVLDMTWASLADIGYTLRPDYLLA